MWYLSGGSSSDTFLNQKKTLYIKDLHGFNNHIVLCQLISNLTEILGSL